MNLKVASPSTEVSRAFLQGMLNRMAVSYHKYGPIADGYPKRLNAIASLTLRLDAYLGTGNTEFLIDAANFAMIEFMHPNHPDAYFAGTDSSESPGRVTQTGRIVKSERNNRLLESDS